MELTSSDPCAILKCLSLWDVGSLCCVFAVTQNSCRLGGVVVSVLATGPKGCWFRPCLGDGFLRAKKSAAHFPSDGRRSHVVRFCGLLKIPWGISDTDRQKSCSLVHFSYIPQISVLVGLPESSGGRVRSYPQPASSSSPWLSMLTYHPGNEQ
jgi:hypothetical protein